MVELGWLATTAAAHQDGYLPKFRAIRQDGLAIIDEWGYLTPDLHWRHGRWMGESRLECLYAFELLASTCQAATSVDMARFASASEASFVSQIVNLQAARGSRAGPAPVCIYSPRLPDPYTRSAWLAALPGLIPLPYRLRLRRLEVDPALLVRMGYRMLYNEWTAHGFDRPETAEALAVFGLGALGLFPRWRCAVCFRLSMPGVTRCWLHSQAELLRLVDKKLHSRNAAAARLGKRVTMKLKWRADELLNPLRTDARSEEKTVAGILWNAHIDEDGFSFELLREKILEGKFPNVRKLLGIRFASLNNARAFALLRSRLDRNEWIVSSWYIRVFAAERWLEAAGDLSPGRRQSQVAPQTVELVTRARTLIGRGLNQKEAADLLKIKPPYLSRLLKRFPPA